MSLNALLMRYLDNRKVVGDVSADYSDLKNFNGIYHKKILM